MYGHMKTQKMVHLPNIKITPQSALRKIGIKTRNRLKRVYKSLLGDEECTSNEIILSRLLFLLLAAEVYIHAKSQWYELYKKSIEARKRMETRKCMEAERKERLAAYPEDDDGERCCVCFSEPEIIIPCKNSHPASKICSTCLDRLYNPVNYGIYGTKPGKCPLCREMLKPLS